jgi:hypothetical protein
MSDIIICSKKSVGDIQYPLLVGTHTPAERSEQQIPQNLNRRNSKPSYLTVWVFDNKHKQ